MDGDRLEGILSDRDVKLACGLHGVDVRRMHVRDICVLYPYETGPDTPLDEVVMQMAKMRYGSTIITENSKVIGIFTTVDACRVLAQTIRGESTRE